MDRIITDLGVFDIGESGFETIELAPGISMSYVRSVTEAEIKE